jgi:hypothetical protein
MVRVGAGVLLPLPVYNDNKLTDSPDSFAADAFVGFNLDEVSL